MTTDRVTISLPKEMRDSTQKLAEESGVSFSSIVVDALGAWMRGRIVDQWLQEYQDEHGTFDEEEVKAVATKLGLPYLPPGRPKEFR